MLGREEKVPQTRLTAVQYVILAIFALLAFGLWRLQIVQQEKYDTLAQMNRVREVPILAPRGKILDREGRIIVDNYPSFSALLLRDQKQSDLEADLDGIAAGLHLDPAELRQRVKRMMALPGFNPIFLKFDVTPDELAFIESHRNEYPELDTITVHRRLYPKNGFAAHLIGYVGEVSEEMLNQPQFQFYGVGDIVGQSGVEKYYNDILMGQNGSRRVLVNSRGKEMGELSDKPAVPGKQLKLTIDIDLQIAAEEALEGKNGAIVAMDPRTGEVLAMVSRPAFDPNAFAVRISRQEWNELLSDPAKPLLNKAIQAQLAPGSVFKIIMSVAGWQEGIAQKLTIHCGGGGTFYGRFFKCWVKGGHGAVAFPRAIYQSCDTYFYTLAERLGIGRIAKYATMFGLGQKTGIDLPQEVSGVMPSEEWKAKNFKQKWYAGETISVGIGQGAVATTPVQLMRAIGAITSDGVLRRPHVAFPEGLPPQYLQAVNYTEQKQIPIDDEGWKTITDAMAEVVNPIGTAPSAHLNGIDFAGKTGSSQTISNAMKAKVANKAEYRDNGWFVGVEPRRNPEIVVVVLVEGGEHGYLSGRLAAQVVKAYVAKQRAKQQVNVAGATSTPSSATPALAGGPALAEKPPVAPPATTARPQAKPPAGPAITPEAAGTQPSQAEPAKPAPPAESKPKPAEITGVPGKPVFDSPGWELTGVWGGTDGHMHGGRFRFTKSGKFQRLVAAPGMEQFATDGETVAALDSGAAVSRGGNRPHWENLPDLLAIIKAPYQGPRQMATFHFPGWRSGGQR